MYVKLLAIIAVCCLGASCSEAPKEPLPPLLAGATSGGGSDSLCDPLPPEMRDALSGGTPETASHSPEIVARLEKQFPRGSSASALERALIKQGFNLESCKSPNVKLAIFRQTGNNGVAAYQAAFANVTWKTDTTGRIVWTTGNISFTGL